MVWDYLDETREQKRKLIALYRELNTDCVAFNDILFDFKHQYIIAYVLDSAVNTQTVRIIQSAAKSDLPILYTKKAQLKHTGKVFLAKATLRTATHRGDHSIIDFEMGGISMIKVSDYNYGKSWRVYRAV